MAYLEPGVYSQTISSRPNTGSGAPSLFPLIIGSGATVMKATEVITRGSDEYDTLPANAVDIIAVGYTSKRQDFTKNTDYELDTTHKDRINWLVGATAKPQLGESYTVTYTYKVGADQYTPKFITSYSQLEAYYGSDVQVDGSINNIFLAAKIMLEAGASNFYMLQVEPNESKQVTATQYQKALDEHAMFLEDVWRIIPVDLGNDINSVIRGHVKTCSSYEERKERCAIITHERAHELRTAAEVESTVGGYADSISDERVTVVYPGSATKTLSDEVTRSLTGQFVAAAFAGMEASLPIYRSKTRATTSVFETLLGVQLTRAEKNRIAEKGVLLFEQPNGPDTDIVCRHQVTTNMDSAEYRENSILACKDYTAKYLRKVLDTYIGKYNVTADTITKVKGSIEAIFASIVADQILIEGALSSIAQDENNPDTLIVEVTIKVPYPCNYIKLTIISE